MYQGGKGKTYQHLINLMPPHKKYIEPFLGFGSVLRKKKPAEINIGNDLDERCLVDFDKHIQASLFNMDAVELLSNIELCDNTLVYCDPPYVSSTRRKKKIYRHEYTDLEHERLLQHLLKQSCMVLISGYENEIYNHYLKDWNSISFSSQTQNGVRTECVWFNFTKPKVLHDTRYLGSSFRERETIKRRQQRLKRKFLDMDPVERSAMIRWLNSEFPTLGNNYE